MQSSARAPQQVSVSALSQPPFFCSFQKTGRNGQPALYFDFRAKFLFFSSQSARTFILRRLALTRAPFV
jgi:hypothetical protein